MKALSIQQPWSSLILAGFKSVENRTWRTPYRGPLLVHAGKTVDRSHINPQITEQGGYALADKTGLILGIVELVDCVPVEDCQLPWACGPWCWLLREPLVFRRPFSFRGKLLLFDVPDELIAEADPIPPRQWLAENLIQHHSTAFGEYLRTTPGATTANE